jgi:hypothetical protein
MDITVQGLAELLQKLSNTEGLGFHPARSHQKFDYIYVKAGEQPHSVWHRLTGDKNKPVESYLSEEEGSVTGRLANVTLTEVQTTYGDSIKVDLTLDIGSPLLLIIRSGATTFSEGVIRSLLTVKEKLVEPITITPIRADKSDKAIFADVSVGSKLLIYSKDMPRLITWSAKKKPTDEEVMATFLPAVNYIRTKLLNLLPLDKAVQRESQADMQTSSQLPPQNKIEFPERKAEITQLMSNSSLTPNTVTQIVEDNFGASAKITTMTTGDYQRLKTLIEHTRQLTPASS